MKYLILTLALAGCATTQPQVQTECLEVGTSTGSLTLCPLPAGIVCVEKKGALSCFQITEPRSY